MYQKHRLRQNPPNQSSAGGRVGVQERSKFSGDESGAVLMLVLLVLALISALVLAWAQEWRVELKLTGNFKTVHQSRRLAEAGVYYAIGKLMITKVAEAASSGQPVRNPGLWHGDQSLHVLEFPDGQAEIRVADESGKINLNYAPGMLLRALFTVLGVSEPRLSIMVDSIEDWRNRGNLPRPFGAKSDYYLGLNPPYVARNDKFKVVEELAWVRGFEADPLLPRLGNLLTVQKQKGESGTTINFNAAPLEVLETMGFRPDTAQALIAAREIMPFTNTEEIPQLAENPLMSQFMQLSFQTSPFFTITSTGQAKNQGGRYVIKAMVRIDDKLKNLWEIVAWFDGFPTQ
jgi:general secretion pathway protein K